jgi:hypothetical protein
MLTVAVCQYGIEKAYRFHCAENIQHECMCVYAVHGRRRFRNSEIGVDSSSQVHPRRAGQWDNGRAILIVNYIHPDYNASL